MTSQLNIKDAELTEKLRALARQDGTSVTATMRVLVNGEWQRRESERAERLARMTAFTKELQASIPDELRRMTSREIMDSIYDDDQPDGFAR